MNLIQRFSQVNTSVRKDEIKYIVIHYTAGVTSSGKSDENTAAWFAKSTTKASSDFIVDDDSVTQFNSDIKGRYTWHCGGSKLKGNGGTFYNKCKNSNSIGVELCSNNKTGKVTDANDDNWYFTNETINNAVELVKKLMSEYNIPIENVIRHYDVTSKLCPGVVGWNYDSGDENSWLDFKKKLVDSDYYEAKYKELLEKYDTELNKLIGYKDKYEELSEKYNNLLSKITSIQKIVKI